MDGIEKIGRDGEKLARLIIKDLFKPNILLQADWMMKQVNSKWYLIEVKHQERFLSPPFDGHGLPQYQVNARLQLYKDKDIRPMLIVIEIPTNNIYCQWLDVLEKTKYYDTKGKKQRRIYDLKHFKVLKAVDICINTPNPN